MITGFKALSADIEDDHVLRLHFDHAVTDADRAALGAAINAARRETQGITGTKHTPGPWEAVKPLWPDPYRVRHIVDADRHLIARVDFANAHQSENEAIANARLIAAAPDLLAALKDILEAGSMQHVRADLDSADIWERARGAIVKAEGAP
jgi:hypothetical protein